MADYLNIAGRVRTTASDGVAMEAHEVKDLNLNKSQQEINADVQTELGDRYTKEETYNREELNELITTPDVNRVYVIATNLTTAVTDLLPATGSSDTLYNVGNWDGTQYDTTVYSIYGWDGTAYVCLAVRSSIGEVYDISANHPDGQGNPTPYADLAAALGTGGANVPVGIRRGGMSIKFIQGTVQSSDNKYIQARCMAQNFTTDVTQWQSVDDVPTALGMTSTNIINKYIAEIYIYDSSVTLTQVDFAIASYVSIGQYAGKYLNLIRLRTSAGNKTIYSEYCDSEAIALSNFRQVTSKKVIGLNNNYMVCLSNSAIKTTSLASGTPTFATYSDLLNLPNIKNYFQDNDIVNKTGQELTLNSIINGYIKELVYSNQDQSTAYVKVYVYIGYEASSVYYNNISVDEFDSTDTRILRTELVRNTYNTLEDALANIPTGIISGDWGEILLADKYPFNDSFAAGDKVLHSLTYEYTPILKGIKAEEEIHSDINDINKVISTGYLYKDDVLVENPYINYTMNLTEGIEYIAEVKLKNVLAYDVTIYVRRYPNGTTTNITSAVIKAGNNYARLTFKAGETNTNQHRIVITNTGQDSYNADVSVRLQKKSLKVLLVGSSFGVNTISMFPVLAKKAGVDITCGSLYYGSCAIGLVPARPLAHHPSKFALNTDYGWYKKFINGAWEAGIGEEGHRTYQYALQDEKWDIIIMQRGAEELRVNVPWSDMQTSCLQQMIEYTRTHCDYEPEILFADGLANPVGWGSAPQTRESQIAQTEHIINTAQEMKSKFGINVIPVGVALQNARLTILSQYGYHGGNTEYPGDMACDSQHLDAGIGYYVTGATLFEYILNPRFGLSIMNLDYLPVVNDVKNCWVRNAGMAESNMFHGISADNINIAKYAVLDAIADPLHVSTTLGQRYSAMYNVTQNLINCKSCFQNTRCETTFFALITPDEGYALGTPTITMGGTDVTSIVYSTTEYDNIVFGVISIPNVTGDIVINLQAN